MSVAEMAQDSLFTGDVFLSLMHFRVQRPKYYIRI